MSVTRRIVFGAAASWFSRGASIFLGLILLPVLFRNLPKEELGVWLLLGQSWAALGVLDLGFGILLTRRIAFAKGRSGSDPNVPLTNESLQEIADLVTTGLRIYLLLALVAFSISFGAGFFYLRQLPLETISHNTVWLAWGILCLSQALSVWANVWTCLLQGVGYIGWDAILMSLCSTLTIAVQITLVLNGGHLVSLALIAASGALLQRFLILGFARRKRPELFAISGRWNSEMLRSMVSPALRAWLTQLGAVLVFQTDQFFIAKFQGVKGLPAYRGAFLLALNMHMLAGVFAGASVVFVSQLWTAGNITEVQRVVIRNLRLGLILVLTGSACVLVLGERLFDVWLGRGNFVGYPILIVLLSLFAIDQQSFILSSSARATGDEGFAPWAIAAGALKIIGSLILIRQFGLLGLALATLLALLLTNHWYVVYRGLKRLQINWDDHVRLVLLPCIYVFGSTLIACWVGLQLLAVFAPIVQVMGVVTISGCVLLGALWLFVLEKGQRVLLQAQWLGILRGL